MSMDEDVGQLLDIICYQLDKEEAKKLLAISGKNLQTAVQKFYDTDIGNLRTLLRDSTATWDESVFGADRYGDNDTTLPTFNIDYAPGFDKYPHSTGHSRAPTRPPSRTSQQSAISTHAGDAPMQSIEGTQESGVVGNINTVFGPATQSHYEASQWAIVPTATEVIADPLPSQRQREEGQPAILKPSPNFNHLQSLIPILHSIPQFRNALLSPGVVGTEYWVGEDWWRGIASPSARIIDESKGLAETHGLDILYEAQRLMAFLDNTDRIYGSVNALLNMDAWKESRPTGLEDDDDDLLKFLLLWGFAFQAQVPDADLNGALRSVVNVAGQHVENFILDGTVTRNSSRPDISVYDVLDETLFSGSNGSAHLIDPSNVLILRLTSSRTNASDLGCRVPATLYADRYLEKNKHIIEGMYSNMQQYEKQLESINAQVEKLKYHSPSRPGAQRVESLKLLETSMKAYQPPADGSESSPGDATVLAQLRDIYHRIESKLTILEEQAQQIQKTCDSISAHFKPIVDDGTDIAMDVTVTDFPEGQSPQDAMHRPYKLWGVATRRDVVYLLHPDIKSDVPDARQWWRMQYDTESTSPVIMRDRLSLQDVLERATTESASVVLVYANETAISSDPAPLPKPLQEFVKKDNLDFLEELQKSTTGWENFGDDYETAVQGDWDKVSLPPFKVRLTVIDTPGFGDYVNNRDSWQPIIEFLDDQHESYMLQEQQPRRSDKIDLRVHACLYFIRPTGHTLKPLDIEVMKKLCTRVNLIPVVAKADTLSPTDLMRFKARVRQVIDAQGIKIYTPPLEDDDAAAMQHARGLIDAMPFSVIGSEKDVQTNDGRTVKGRQYAWGVAEVENEEHCDFKKLRAILIRTHMLDLIHTTEENHYEAYRAGQMETRKFGEARPRKLDNPKFKEEEEALRKRFTEQVKVEEQRFRQWEQKLIAERDRLNKDLEASHAEIKRLETEVDSLQGSINRSHGRR